MESPIQSADSTTDFVIVGRQPVLNMFNISTPIQSAYSSQRTIALSGLQIGLVGMGLKGRRTRADKMKLSVHLGKISVKKSVEFNTTNKVHSVRLLTILYLKIFEKV